MSTTAAADLLFRPVTELGDLVRKGEVTSRELVEASIQQMSTHKRVAGVVLNCVNQSRVRKYGGEYSYGKHYEKYYTE